MYHHHHVFFSVPEIEVAFLMDDVTFKDKYGFDKPDKNAPVVTHCLKGGRAGRAAQTLIGQGYANVKVYAGSFLDWQAQGGPVEKKS